MIRLGLWGGRVDRRGLAIQTGEFARHMHPVRTMGFDLRSAPMSPLPCDWRDFEGTELTVMEPRQVTRDIAMRWLAGLDVVWGTETFYQDAFPQWAADAGVATIQHVNPEFYRFDLERGLPRPTLEISPSHWRADEMSGICGILPTPIALDRCRPHEPPPDEQPLTFLHVVGVRAIEDRNGSDAIAQALPYVRIPCRLLVLSQGAVGITSRPRGDGIVEVEVIRDDRPDYWRLYDDGDVLLMPRRYGGQSLPLQEAAACGLPAIMTNIEPQTRWLPEPMLVPAHEREEPLVTQAGPIPVYDPDPIALAAAMDWFSEDRDRWHMARTASLRWARQLGWDAMRSEYEAAIDLALEYQKQRKSA